MNITRPLSAILLALFTSASRLFAGHFVADNVPDLRALLTPPPAADSLVTRAELDVVLQFQELRTPALAKRAQEIENETLFSFAGDVVGPWFAASKLPKTAALFASVREDFIAVNRASKALWPRKRPPYADPRVKPCVDTPTAAPIPAATASRPRSGRCCLRNCCPTTPPVSRPGRSKRAA